MSTECQCGKKINKTSKRCKSCSNKERAGKYHHKVTHKLSEKHKLAIILSVSGDKAYNWKGDKVGYEVLHDWVKRNKPKPMLCVCCMIRKPYDLANISQKYFRDINDFEWLCRSCHMRKDGRMKNLKNQVAS